VESLFNPGLNTGIIVARLLSVKRKRPALTGSE